MKTPSVYQAFAGEHLRLKFRASRTHTVEIYERPSKSLSGGELDDLITACRTVVAACLEGGQLDYGLFAPDAQAWDRSVVTLVSRRDTGAPVAFNAMPLLPVERGGQVSEVLHLGLVMVDPVERSGGLSWILYGLTCFTLFLRRGMRPLWISSVTQVPAVVGMVAETFSNVYPAPGRATPSFAHRHVAHQIMSGERAAFGVGEEAGFDADTHIITDAYTGGSDNLKKSFDVATKHRDERYNELCARALNYERGDDLLQIGQLDTGAARQFLSRSVPRSALPQLAVQAGMVAVQSLVAPTVQGLDATCPLGRLRPSR